MKTVDILRFNPESALLFRDTRDFGFSENARTVFPTSEPFYGAVRTAFLRKSKTNLRDSAAIAKHKSQIGDRDDPGAFRFVGPFPFLKKNGRARYFLPTPSHLTQWEGGEFGFLRPNPGLAFTYNGISLQTLWDRKTEQGSRAAEAYPWIDWDGMSKIKEGRTPDKAHLAKDDAFFEVEHRTGIGLRSDRKNAQEEMIFRVRSFRFRDEAGLYLFVLKGSDLLEGIDTVLLGGKSGVATTELEKNVSVSLFDKVGDSEKIAVLVTPTIFRNGFLPANSGNTFFGASVEAVCNGKPYPVGGWDLVVRKPKPLMHAVPFGSAFFIKGSLDTEKITEIRSEFGYGSYIECKRNKEDNHGK
ncbi:MAG TPA: type III-B CRISPR module-associated protein Cmr3 [Thermotogota bacterium]|nr:type III-B CRISPR module-associated protein Cmr3 [Thermotogota bacterium]HQQ66749.1 type III-B CRISPR module-associated protein Cmr3 [Thermotogota bacterium]